jgi:alkylhydroperoxidase family enzyme
VDTGTAVGRHKGIDAEKLDAIGDYARSPLFTPAERAAIAYGEEMCRTPVEVPDACLTSCAAISTNRRLSS